MNRLFNTIATAAGVILLTGTFAAAQTAAAQEKAPKAKAEKSEAKAPKTPTASGSIVKSDAASVTIKTAKGEETFAIGADTKITQGQKALTAADLKAGEHATVSYTKAGEQMTATKISVKAAAAKSEKPKEPKAAKTPAEKK